MKYTVAISYTANVWFIYIAGIDTVAQAEAVKALALESFPYARIDQEHAYALPGSEGPWQ